MTDTTPAAGFVHDVFPVDRCGVCVDAGNGGWTVEHPEPQHDALPAYAVPIALLTDPQFVEAVSARWWAMARDTEPNAAKIPTLFLALAAELEERAADNDRRNGIVPPDEDDA